MSPDARRRTDLAWLGGAFVLQAAELARFVRIERRPPAWDQANHLDCALQYLRALRDGRWSVLWTLEPKHYIPPFPPLYHLSLMWAYATKNPAWNALWSNAAYLVVLVLALRGLTREKEKDERGTIAAVAFAAAPAVQWLLHNQLIDLPLCACAAAAYWAWVRSANFSRRGPSLAFGAAFAVGMLHKWSFFSYMLPPLWSAAAAARRPSARANAAASAALAFAAAAPWYLIRVPLLLQRLVQASADQAVPFWRGGAFFAYALALPAEFGLALCAAAAAALWLGRRDPRARALAACAAASYLFWALVPNRQMRYLLPGLVGLPVLAAWFLPRPALWAVAVLQLAGAARADLVRNPPRGDAWPLDEIVRRVDGAGLSVVANHERLNNLNLIWAARLQGRDLNAQTATNKLWELAPFVLLKRGDLGPASASDGLADARAEILRPDGGFARGFTEAGAWTLPDGDEAILYRRRDALPEPFGGRRSVRAARWSSPLFDLERVGLKLGRWSAPRGAYDSIEVRPADASARGLRISNLALALDEARMTPDGGPSAPDALRLISARRARVLSATLTPDDLRAALAAKGVRVDRLSTDGTVSVSGAAKRVPFAAVARVDCGANGIAVSLDSLSIAGIPAPGFLLRREPALTLTPRDGATTVATPYWAGLRRDIPIELSVASCRATPGGIEVR